MARKNKNSDFSINSTRTMRNLSIIGAIIIYSLLRISILGKGQFLGAAYFFNTFDFILLFLISVPYAFLEIVSKHVRQNAEISSYRNCKRVMFFGFFMSVIYTIVAGGIIYCGRGKLISLFLIDSNTELTLMLMIPLLLFISLSCCVKGFFLGAQLKRQLYISEIIEKIAMLVCVFLFEGAFTNYGIKVANILFDIKVGNAFVASGAALGLTIGSIIGFIATFVIYLSIINGLLMRDDTRRLNDVYDLSVRMTTEVLTLGLTTLLLALINFINQVIFNKAYTSNYASERLYISGAYFGVFWTVVICPLLFTYVYSFFDRYNIRKSYSSGDRHEVRIKTNSMIKQYFIYFVPLCIYISIMADIIVKFLVGTESVVATNIIRIGIFAAIMYGLAILLVNVLIGMGRLGAAILSGVITAVVDTILAFILIGKLNLGASGLVICFYIYSIVYMISAIILVRKYLKYNPQIIQTIIRPVILGIMMGVIVLVLRIGLGFFAGALLNILITGIVAFITMFVLYGKSGVVNSFQAVRSPINFIIVPIGKIFKLFK